MKHITFILLFFAFTVSSCKINHSQESLRAECDSLLELSLKAYDADLREVAINYCNQAISIDSSYWKNYNTKALFFYSEKGYDSAIIAFEKAYKFRDKYDTLPKLMYTIARTYQELEQYDKALIIAQEALLTNPEDFSLMDIISLCYALQGKYDMAEKWALRALEIHKDGANAYFRLGWLYHEMGRTAKAIEYYEKTLEINSEYSAAMNNLSILYWNSDRNRARVLRIKAARLGSDNARKWCKENSVDY